MVRRTAQENRDIARTRDRHRHVPIDHRFAPAAGKYSIALDNKKIVCHRQLSEPCQAVLIKYCKHIVHRAQQACFLAMAGGHVLHFGARKVAGLRLAGPSQGHAKTGVWHGRRCSRRGDRYRARRPAQQFPPSGSRLLTLGSLAAVVLAISLGFAFSGALLVLPFAGLELLVVGLAFRYMEQRAAVPSERTPENPLIQGTLLGEV